MKDLLKGLLKFWTSFIFMLVFTYFLCYIFNELNVFWEVAGFQFEIYFCLSIMTGLLVFLSKEKLL